MRQNAARVSGIFLVLARNHWWADHRSRYANAARPANGQPPGKKAARTHAVCAVTACEGDKEASLWTKIKEHF
jgi:hypothetical protein